MKKFFMKYLFIVFVLLLCTQSAHAQPIISVTPTFDFGEMLINSSKSLTITITNTGTTDLVISGVSISRDGFTLSGIITTSWALIDSVANIIRVTHTEITTPITIVAGTSLTIAVQFSPTEVRAYTGTLTLTHNARGGSTEINLVGKGVSSQTTADITITPNPLDFGDVTINTPTTQNIIIQNGGTADLVISQATINGTGFTLSGVSNPITIAAGGSLTIAVQFRPNVAGSYRGTVTLTHNVGDGSSTISLIGYGVSQATPNITITPSQLDFGDVTINTSTTQNITIQNSGTADLVISQTTINGTGFTLSGVNTPITIIAGGSRTIRVQFLPTTIISYAGTVALSHNATGSPTTINLTGTGVVAIPGIAIRPNQLDFGNVIINTPTTQNIIIQNGGTADLVISQATINGTGFTLLGVSTPITIAAGGSRIITIQFLPTIVGSHTGTLTLTHNASDGSTEINLTGRGVVQATPNPLDFGDVTINTSSTQSITIQNCDTADFVISQTTINGTGFTLSGVSTPITITTGGSHAITVQFLPTTATNYTGTITLTHNTEGSPTTVPISGNGIQTISVNEPEDIMGDGGNLLFQSNPNPIRSGYDATISYRINTAGTINLTVYDVLGREVAKLADDYKSSGIYSVNFSTKGLPSGVYFYRLRAPGYEGLKKMVVVR